MRPKTKRRLVVLTIAAAVTVGGLGGLYQFRQTQIQKKLMTYRTEGMDASARGDYDEALKSLSNYVGKPQAQKDTEALLAYGTARTKVSEADGRHIVEGIGIFRRYLDLKPDDVAAKHTLLSLYTTAGYASEAIKLADDLLARDPNDADALLAKSSALASQGKYDDALPLAARFVDRKPTDLTGQTLAFQILVKKGAPAADLLKRYEALKAAHPGDPKFDLMIGLTKRYANDPAAALASYREAAKTPSGDAEFISMLAQQFDALNRPEEADAVIERSAARSQDAQVMLVLVRRLWQAAKYDAILDRLKDVNPASRTSNTQLIAFRALCQLETGRTEDARASVDALAARKDDPSAVAWSMAFHAAYLDNPAPKAAVEQLRAALVRDPGNVVIKYQLAQAYGRLGENELALRVYREIVDPARPGALPMWPAPYEQMARVYMNTGRPMKGWEAAAEAYKKSPGLQSQWHNAAARSALVTLAEALARVAEADRTKVPTLLQTLQKIQAVYPNEPRTLPIYVTLLSQIAEVKLDGKSVPGRDVAKDLIAKFVASKPTDAESCLRLATVSRTHGLGAEDALLAAAEQAAGAMTPAVARARADWLAAAGKPADGLALLRQGAEKAAPDAKLDWRIAEAQFRETTRDKDAAATWRDLATTYPDALRAQTATLGALSAWGDRELMGAVVDRVRKLTGDDGVVWRLARARFLLLDPKADDRMANEAVVLLTDVVRISPDLIPPRLMLARALRTVNNTIGGIEHLAQAAALDPNSPGIVLDLVKLLQQQGRLDEARAAARKAADNENLSPRYRTQFATVLGQLGDQQGAMDVMKKLADSGVAGDSPDPTSDLAREAALAYLNWQQGRLADAERMYRALLDRKDLDADTAAAAADFFAARGDAAAADKALATVLARPLAPGVADLIRAHHAERGGDAKTAADRYAAAVKAAPNRAEAWGALAGFQVRQDNWDAALATAADAAKANPADASLKAMADNLKTLSAFDGRSKMRMLADAATRTPGDPAVSDTLAVLQKSRGEIADPAVATALSAVADRHPKFLPAYELVISARTALGHRAEVAAAAERALANFPNSARAAELATLAYVGVGRWAEAEFAGAAWRKLSPDNPVPADLMIADAQVRQNRPDAALARLRPYLADPGQSPPPALVLVAARASIAKGDTASAAAMLKPLAAASPEWRARWLALSTEFADPVTAGGWISEVKKLLDKNSTKEQFALGQTLYNVAARTGAETMFAEARAVLDPLAAAPDAPDRVLVVAGLVSQRMHDTAAAEALYRRARAALKAGPQSAQVAMTLALVENNIAYVMLHRPGADMDEARTFAEDAVRLRPVDADYRDTLARVYAKLGQSGLAERTFREALRLDPNKLETLVALGVMLSDAGQPDKAAEVVDQIDRLPASATPLDKTHTEQLRLLKERRKAATGRAAAS